MSEIDPEKKQFAQDLKKEGFKQTGLMPGEERNNKNKNSGQNDGAMIGGKFYTKEELDRVKDILQGILEYCAEKHAG